MEPLKHTEIIFAYFEAEKRARNYGFKLRCDWGKRVFNLYQGDDLIESCDDISDMNDILNMHVSNLERQLGE